MKTNLCHMLGIEHPIIAAPMGPDLTGPEFVAAVSDAGGLGILQAQFCPPPLFREQIRRIRALTDRPFGVNLLLHFPVEDQVAICLEERVPILSLFWGDPAPYVGRAHAAGVGAAGLASSIPEGNVTSSPACGQNFPSGALPTERPFPGIGGGDLPNQERVPSWRSLPQRPRRRQQQRPKATSLRSCAPRPRTACGGSRKAPRRPSPPTPWKRS